MKAKTLFQNLLVIIQQRNAIFVDFSHRVRSERERERRERERERERVKKLPKRT